MRHITVLATCTIAIIASQNAFSDELITGINHTAFWAKVGFELSDTSPANNGAGKNGEAFILKVPGHRDAYGAIGIWKDIETAKASCKNQFASMAVAPKSGPLDFGDDAKDWMSRDQGGGCIIFRRSNVTIGVSWPSDRASGLAFARGIDQLLSGGHSSVTKGTFSTPPGIVGLPAQLELAKDMTETITVTFSGLGDAPPAVWIYSPGGLKHTISPDGTIKITRTADNFAERTVQIRAVSATAVTAKAELLVKPKP